MVGMLAMLLSVAAPAIAQNDEYQHSGAGILGEPYTVGQDPTLTYPLTDESTGTSYELISGFVDLEEYVGQSVIFEGQQVPGLEPDPGEPIPVNVTYIEATSEYDAAPEAVVTGLIQPVDDPLSGGGTHTITETSTGDVYYLWSDTEYTGIDLTQYEGTQSTIYGIFQTQGAPISNFEDPTDVLIAVTEIELIADAPTFEPDAIITGIVEPTSNPEAEGSTHTITEESTGDEYGLFSNPQDDGVDLSQYVGQRVTITGYFQTQGTGTAGYDLTDLLIYVESVEVLDSAPATEDPAVNDSASENNIVDVLPDTGGFSMITLGPAAALLLGGGGLLAYSFIRR